MPHATRKDAADAAAHRVMSHAAALLDGLAAPARLRLLAAIVEQTRTGPCTLQSVSVAVARDLRDLLNDIIRLQTLGLVSLDGDVLSTQLDVLEDAASGLIQAQPFHAFLDQDPQVARFFRHGRLVALPQNAPARQHLADALAHLIPSGRVLTEEEINTRLAAVHDDYASLRRLLVDLGALTRRGSSDYQRVQRSDPDRRSHA